jgi:hypothetical protein
MNGKSQYTLTVVLYGLMLGVFGWLSICYPTYWVGFITAIFCGFSMFIVWFAAGAVENLHQLEITKSNLALLNELKTTEVTS